MTPYFKLTNLRYLFFNSEVVKLVKSKRFKILLSPNNGIVDKVIYSSGEWEPQICDVIKNNLSESDVFLDIGTNIGYISLFAASCIDLSVGEIHSFEPIKKIHSQFNKSIKINNFNNIYSYNFACANKEETKNIHISNCNIGGSSIIKRNSDYTELIKIVRLDDFLSSKLNKLDFVKIDTEGFEFEVLKGMENLINKFRPKIILEYSFNEYFKFGNSVPKDLLDFISSKGYEIFVIEENMKEIRNIGNFISSLNPDIDIQLNLFCKPKLN